MGCSASVGHPLCSTQCTIFNGEVCTSRQTTWLNTGQQKQCKNNGATTKDFTLSGSPVQRRLAEQLHLLYAAAAEAACSCILQEPNHSSRRAA
jgi:hypothetical protein